ncbi:choline O-acetyltransferase isoform X2 [Phymastichus coffea]|uniref:choline O-acetyltransferase isoform X2 n=1 Tax=Phymastichus coffea TaxID=108790 RepID=UPI00273AFAD8|nr:choline O-acetyltransferase isoform X2 [Phymastichus coffea]
MQKYLAQVEAIAPQHLEKSRNLVKAFLSGSGPKLQQRLIERRQSTINWATEWWLKDMYLSIPLALPINSNPGLSARPKHFSNYQEAAVFLARFLIELLNYQEILDKKELNVEKIKSTDKEIGSSLCMNQQYQIFSLYRRPGLEIDEHVHLDRVTAGNHIIVAHHNQFYRISVRSDDKKSITEIELIQQILQIMEVPADTKSVPVGILTSNKRPIWAKARKELLKNDCNRHNIELLERCLCIVCLDDQVLPKTFNNSVNPNDLWIGERDYANVLHHALHGGGSRFCGGNRWFDKTVHFILGKDGFWGLTYEHSAGEAPAIFKIFEELTEKVDRMPTTEKHLLSSHLPAPEKLKWLLSDQSYSDIHEAIIMFDTLVEDLDLCILWFEDYSKEFVKNCNISPDVYVQLALQLTYFRLHGSLVATYESAGIRRFAHGRVDVIRAASPETLAWVKAMCQGYSDDANEHGQEEGTKRNQRTIELFNLAIQRQTKEMLDNITGFGMDNHLMGLRYIAMESGETIPELFNDEAYKITQHFTLSTSQITTKNDTIGGYGPVVPDGYGCGYNIRKNGFIFSCSAFQSNENTNARKFAVTLRKSLQDMASMLKNSKQS